MFDFQLAVQMHRFSLSDWWVSLLLGIVGMVFAILLFVHPFDGATALMIFIGVSLVVGSIEHFYTIHCISKAVKTVRDSNFVTIEVDGKKIN